MTGKIAGIAFQPLCQRKRHRGREITVFFETRSFERRLDVSWKPESFQRCNDPGTNIVFHYEASFRRGVEAPLRPRTGALS